MHRTLSPSIYGFTAAAFAVLLAGCNPGKSGTRSKIQPRGPGAGMIEQLGRVDDVAGPDHVQRRRGDQILARRFLAQEIQEGFDPVQCFTWNIARGEPCARLVLGHAARR